MIAPILMTIIGFGIVNLMLKEESVWEKLALGFLLGFGLVILSLFFLIYFHVRLNQTIVWEVMIPLLLISSFLLFVSFAKRNVKTSLTTIIATFKKLSGVQKLLIFLIVALFVSSFVINYYWPVNTWDSVALYDIKAKIYASGGLLTDLWTQLDENVKQFGYYYSYPPATSLAHAVSYIFNDTHVMIVYTFFYVSLVIIFLTNLSRKTSLTAALFTTFLLASNSTLFYHSTIAYTNLPYTSYLIALFFMLERYITSKKRIYFMLAICFSIFSISIRTLEPFYIVIAALLLVDIKKSWYYVLDFFVIVTISYFFGKLVGNYFNRDLYYVSGQSANTSIYSASQIAKSVFSWHRIWDVLTYLYSALHYYHIYFLMFIVSTVAFKKSIKKNFPIGIIILLSVLILIPGALVLSTVYVGWNKIPDSVNRAMLMLYPLTLYFVASFPEVGKLLDALLYFYPKRILRKLKEA